MVAGVRTFQGYMMSLFEKVMGWYDNLLRDALYAFFEMFVIYILSNMSIFVLILVHILSTPGADLSFSEAQNVVENNVQAGEILLYLSAILAPVIYEYIKQIRVFRHRPMTVFFLLMPFGFYAIAGIIFIISEESNNINRQLFGDFALTVYVCGVGFWLLALIYRRRIVRDPYKDKKQGAAKIMDDLEAREEANV